jgi:DNA polymerase III delta prime subunit
MTNPLSSLWVEAYRPKTLEDIVLSKDDREFFESLLTKKEIPHLLFAGSQGLGKTSLSLIIAKQLAPASYMILNASDTNGIDTARGTISNFAKTKSIDGNMKIIICDEFCNFSVEGQKCLRNLMESFAENTRFIITANYLHKVIAPIQSRCQIINLNPTLESTVARIVEILKKENITIPQDQKPLLLNHIRKYLPDIRRIVNDMQKFSVTGTLNIKTDVALEFVEKIFKKLCNKPNLVNIRKEIIENERAFSNDYHSLLKQLFEVVFESDLPSEKKTEAMLIISKSMEQQSFVIDKEIGAFSALISLSKVF